MRGEEGRRGDRCSPGGLRAQKVALPRHFPGRCLSPIPFHISPGLPSPPLPPPGFGLAPGIRPRRPGEGGGATRDNTARHYALAGEEAHGSGTQHGLSTARLWRQARVLATCSPPGMNSSPGSRFPLRQKTARYMATPHGEIHSLSIFAKASAPAAPRASHRGLGWPIGSPVTGVGTCTNFRGKEWSPNR